MRRSGAALSFALVRPAILAFVALFVALFFAAPCALAEEPVTGGNDPGERQGGNPGDQHFTATLYDDGELVIEKVVPDSPRGSEEQGEVVSAPGEGEPNDGAGDSAVPNAAEPPEGRTAVNEPKAEKPLATSSLALGGESPKRAAVTTYANVAVSIERPDDASWYGDRDKIKSVSFGQDVDPQSLAFWFAGLTNLSDIEFSGLDTSKATSMQSLFDGCSSLRSLDLASFDTGNVTNMSRLFAGCSSLTALDLSRFDTGNVASMDGMFEGCSGICSLDLSGFDTRKASSASNMLKGCTSLAALDVSSFSPNQLTTMALPIDNKGGYWRLNVPAGFVTNIVLREPTAAERAAAGLAPVNPSKGKGGLHGSNTNSNANVDAALRTIGSLVSPAGAVMANSTWAVNGFAAFAMSLGSTRQAGSINGSGPDAVFDILIPDAIVHLLTSRYAVLARAITANSSEAGRGLMPFCDALLDSAVKMTAALMSPIESMKAMANGLTARSLPNPMLPLGIPLNLFATTLLLVLVIPSTLLLLRDRR